MRSAGVLTILSAAVTVALAAVPVPLIDEDTTFLEANCGKVLDIAVTNKVHRIRLSQGNQVSDPTCRVFITINSTESKDLVVTIPTLRITDRESQGVCIQHFLQINGLEGNQQYVRFCGSDVAQETNVRIVLSPDEDKVISYSRHNSPNSTHDINIKIVPLAKVDVYGACPAQGLSTGPEYFKCLSGSLCVPESSKCDKVPDCEDASDEFACGTTTPKIPITTTAASVAVSNTVTYDRAVETSVKLPKAMTKKPFIIGGIVGGLLIVALVVVLAIFIIRRRRSEFQRVATTEVRFDDRRNEANVLADEERINTTPKDEVIV